MSFTSPARVASTLLLAVLAAGPNIALADQSSGQSDDRAQLARLTERWRQAMEKLHVPGLAVVAVRDGEVVFMQTLGERDPQRHLPVTEDTAFYIASCTKSFVAMVIMQLAEEGKIDLDAPVRQYLPRFQLADAEAAKSLKVRDLLCHGQGLASRPLAFLEAYSGDITEERFYRWLAEVKPSGEFKYNNLNYTLLGRIIESVTGKSWKENVHERIFKPLGMDEATAYADEMYGRPDVAVPTEIVDGRVVPAEPRKTNRTMHAAGGLGASISDLGRWLQVNLGDGAAGQIRVLSPENTSRMQQMQASVGDPQELIPGRYREGYGYGWVIGSYRGQRLLDHGGGYAGTSAVVSFMPERNIGVAAVANAEGLLVQLAIMDVYDVLLGHELQDMVPRLVERQARQQAAVKKEREALGANPAESPGALSLPADSYAGVYTNPDWGTIHITVDGGKLGGSIGDLPLILGTGEKDGFRALAGDGSELRGRFETSNRAVVAITAAVSEVDGEVRFQKE